MFESLITGIGTSIARGILKLWLKDEEIGLDVALGITDILSRKASDLRERRVAQRQMEQIADRAAESVQHLLDREGAALDEARQEYVANAASTTIENTPITADLLARNNLDPNHLLTYFQGRSGTQGGNPGTTGSGLPTDRSAIMLVKQALAASKRLFVRVPAGAGKTTLLQWVSGLEQCASSRELYPGSSCKVPGNQIAALRAK